MHRLEQLVESRLQPTAEVEALEHQLNRAVIIDPDRISSNVVTMNSRVRIHDLNRDSETTITIVFPSEANAEQNRISVLAPLGRTLLGAAVGQTVRFEAPGGTRRVKITAIEYQPEAAARDRISVPSALQNPRSAA